MIDLAADPHLRADSKLGAGASAASRAENILLRRWFGCWIDFLTMGALFFATAVPAERFGDEAAVITGGLAVLAYFPVTEGVWGRSLGKLASGTIVVDAQGQRPAIWRVIVRTLTRLIEANPFLLGGIPAGLIANFTKRRQRLGDLLAGTYVVPVKDLAEARARLARRNMDVFD
ncbi:RDD family protein [Phenylobacterium sp. 20VBR1]|uniref:RDD family protein n=1 Tax=Phenylobacterium glaciei TaxID=2803784 RepID=A0A941D1S4_9CAUL|nr:RDD family protein [Phenylobacterium glaciei]MBR7620352.1 RDD family protein [Phenylobacterium glaciei]